MLVDHQDDFLLAVPLELPLRHAASLVRPRAAS
jgi:hypothetical protein